MSGVRQIEPAQLGEILGSLLASIVGAQAQAASATVDFVTDVGLEPQGDALRMAKMRYRKLDENNQEAEFEVQIPLLALLSVPSLAIKTATLDFSYDVLTTTAPEPDPQPVPGTGRPLPAKVATLKGLVRKPAANERTATAIDVSVTLEQQTLPVGLERMLDLAELSMSERRTSPPP